ncbi:MAG: hypothetical protein ABR576_12620 [Thermoanaerobaculia bacterium]
MPCPSPLDPLDIEALAAGADPVISDRAAAHAAGCAFCAEDIRRAQTLSGELERLDEDAPALPTDFVDRILRVRPFSSSERRRFSLWRLPLATAAAVFATGVILLGVPVLTGAEQAGLSAALLGPAAGLLRAMARSAADAVSQAPSSFDALSSVLRGNFASGLLLLLLLLPASFGLRRAVSRARSPR